MIEIVKTSIISLKPTLIKFLNFDYNTFKISKMFIGSVWFGNIFNYDFIPFLEFNFFGFK